MAVQAVRPVQPRAVAACVGLFIMLMVPFTLDGRALAGTDSDVRVEEDSIVIQLESNRSILRSGGSTEYFEGCSFIRLEPGDSVRVWWEAQGFQDFSLAESETDLLRAGPTTVVAGYCPPASGVGFGPRQVPTTWWRVGTPGSEAVRASLVTRALERIPFPVFEIDSAPDGFITPFLTNLAVGFRPSAPVESLTGDASLPFAPLTVGVRADPIEVAFLEDGVVLTVCSKPFPTDAELLRARVPSCSFNFEKPTESETTTGLELRVTYETETRCVPSCAGDPAMQVGNITVSTIKPVRIVEARGLRT